MNAIFIFRRDLRLEDNTGLIAALKESKEVIPIFILDKRQLENNPYKSENLVEFMFESLKDLDMQLKEKGSKLYLFYGETKEIINNLIKETNAKKVYINRDYTPFSKKRDDELKDICENLLEFSDSLLHEPKEVKKKDNTPYTVFTPFYKYARTLPVREPIKNNHKNYYKKNLKEEDISFLDKLLKEKNPNKKVIGKRTQALKILKNIKKYNNYDIERDFPEKDKTTHLSAYNKFGIISIREVYKAIKDSLGEYHQLIVELYWRDFFTHIAYHFPHVFGNSYKRKYDKINWQNNKTFLNAWKEGKTGFPIVDAGMRELNQTGYMHNRVRMIVASFLVKDLHIDWREGEKYFAQKLIDYDASVNNGNWQWAASTGCDAQPYFRIFNPWLQQKKFDKDAKYIKKWVPELKELSAKEIHQLETKYANNYTKQIINHKEEKEKTLFMFKEVTK